MGAIDSNGVYKYSSEDTVNTWENFLNLGMNSVSNAIQNLRYNGVYCVTNIQGATTKRMELERTGLKPTGDNPFLFYLKNNGKFITWDGAAWKMNGDSIASWMVNGNETFTPATPCYGKILWGQQGEESKFRQEMGVSVLRITEWSY